MHHPPGGGLSTWGPCSARGCCPSGPSLPPPHTWLQPAGLTLYRGQRSATGGFSWEEAAAGVHAGLYDANEDAPSKKPDWHFELTGGPVDLDAVIDDDFVFDRAARRVVFAVDATIWALYAPDAGAFDALFSKYERALFENKWGLAFTPENQAKVGRGVGRGLPAARTSSCSAQLCAGRGSGGPLVSWADPVATLHGGPGQRSRSCARHPCPSPHPRSGMQIQGTDGLQIIGKETAESLRAWADDMDVDVRAGGVGLGFGGVWGEFGGRARGGKGRSWGEGGGDEGVGGREGEGEGGSWSREENGQRGEDTGGDGKWERVGPPATSFPRHAFWACRIPSPSTQP